jgi:hypothetical protein
MRLNSVAALCVAGLMLAGCTQALMEARETYGGVEIKSFTIDGDDAYRIFDRADLSQLVITPSLANAAAMGAVRGVTLGIVETLPRGNRFEPAVLGYLASTGRQGCRIVSSDLVQQPQWEFKYDCPPPMPVVAAPVIRKKR